MKKGKRLFTRYEESIHSLTHGLGALGGIVGLVFLILKTSQLRTIDLVSSVIFGASLIFLYSSSCLYHASCAVYGADSPKIIKIATEKLDHCAIFVLITGTYVPACLSTLGGWLGCSIFCIVAACGVLGIVLNCISVRRFAKISLALYVIAGWMIIIASVPYAKVIGSDGFSFLLGGGILYTVGIVFYKLNRIKYMHILWHLFVLAGSVLHYIMVYSYCY